MRTPFVAFWPTIAIAMLTLTCGAGRSNLPGFPVVMDNEGDGPTHIQRLARIEADHVVIYESLETDGRPTWRARILVDRHGQVRDRRPAPVDEDPGPEPPLIPLPIEVGANSLVARRQGSSWEIWLVESTHEGGSPEFDARLAVLPRASSTRIGGVALSKSEEGVHQLAALCWRSEEDGAIVRGIQVLDLTAGLAALHQKRGTAAKNLRDFQAARNHFLAAWEIDPQDPLRAYNLAGTLAGLGEVDDALHYLELAIELDGPRMRVLSAHDQNLDPLRPNPRFTAIVGPTRASHEGQ